MSNLRLNERAVIRMLGCDRWMVKKFLSGAMKGIAPYNYFKRQSFTRGLILTSNS